MDFDFNDPEFTEKLDSPEGIQELLNDEMQSEEAEAEIESEGEQEEYEADEGESDSEESAEEVLEEEPEKVDPEKDESLKFLRQQANYERQRAERLESEMASIKQMLMEAGNQTESDDLADDDGIIDEAAHKKLAAMEAAQQQDAFQNALNTADIKANATYADFGDAYGHLMQQKAAEVAAVQGLDANQAAQQAKVFMRNVALNAFKGGRDISDTFYALSKAAGYQGAVTKPPKGGQPNPKAIAKNRAKTEKKQSKAGSVDDMSGGSVMELMERITTKGGGVDNAAFQKILNKMG